jgi:predicted Zn finger-like uncharacterized protein
MIITCEKCGGSFKLDEKLIKPGGTKLQCSKCRHIFRAFPPGETGPAKGPSEIELIVCEKCGAGFKMKSALLQPEGSKVRCSKCRHIFFAFSSDTKPKAKEEAVGITRPTAGRQEAAPKPQKSGPGLSFKKEEVDDTAVFSDELDLDLEETPEKSAAKASDDMELELDLDEDDAGDDLELELEETPKKAVAKASDDVELELDLEEDDAGGDLELELEETPKQAAAKAADDVELELDLDEDDAGGDLELDEDDAGDDLDLELEEKPKKAAAKAVSAPKGSSDDEEIDFSEVDDLLESEDVSVADTVEVSSHDLGFSLDEDGDSGGGVEQQEIDLADLEQTIEMELLEPEDDAEKEAPEDVELELADDDADEDADEEESMAEGDGDDFSDIEEMLAVGEDEETIELDLDGEEEKEKADEEKTEEAGTPAAKGKKAKAAKEKKAKEKKAKEEKAEGETKDKKPLKKVLILAAVIVLVLIGLGAGFFFRGEILSLIGMKTAAPASSGNAVVMENTIQSDFVDNAKHGKLFIIKGSVKNESSAPKRFVKVVANLYSEGRKLEMTSSAYCGNILSNEELATNDLAAINARLAVQVGDNSRNADVKPGMTIPFMVVISQMPENLVEYEVLVSESSPVK